MVLSEKRKREGKPGRTQGLSSHVSPALIRLGFTGRGRSFGPFSPVFGIGLCWHLVDLCGLRQVPQIP